MIRQLHGVLLALFVVLTGCDSTPAECSASQGCGFGEVCIQGQCEAGGCSTSAQCPMEYHCDNRSCVPGCEANEDCLPGSECNVADGTCVDAKCRDTSVDCGFREFCNTGTGECYDAGGVYCKPCDVDNQTADCGEGNYCLNGYCGVDCNGGRECPSGFECYPLVDSSGNVVTFNCFTYCWLYDDYEKGSFDTIAPPTELPEDAYCPDDIKTPATAGAPR